MAYIHTNYIAIYIYMCVCMYVYMYVIQFLVPPTVITPNGSRVVTDEETANFPVSCTAAGIPPPNITWSDPNGMTLPNDRIILEDHTTPELMTDDGFTFLYYVTRNLVITNTSDSDTGNYTCIADNDVVAEDNNTVEVFIRGKYVNYN